MQVEELSLRDDGWNDAVKRAAFVFLDGASASGKSTFKNALLSDEPLGLAYAKRYTTRDPRPDDVQNGDYIFISRFEFEQRLAAGDLIEHRDFLFGMSYGIGKSVLADAAKKSTRVLGLMNLGGVSAVKRAIPKAACILIEAPVEDIEMRLRARSLHMEEQIRERLRNASAAHEIRGEYDFVVENRNGYAADAYAALRKFLVERFGWF